MLLNQNRLELFSLAMDLAITIFFVFVVFLKILLVNHAIISEKVLISLAVVDWHIFMLLENIFEGPRT